MIFDIGVLVDACVEVICSLSCEGAALLDQCHSKVGAERLGACVRMCIPYDMHATRNIRVSIQPWTRQSIGSLSLSPCPTASPEAALEARKGSQENQQCQRSILQNK